MAERIEAAEERLAQTLAFGASTLRRYGVHLNEDGTFVRSFSEMHNNIPIADADGSLRQHRWTSFAHELCRLSPPSAARLGIMEDAGEVDIFYEPQCYERRPKNSEEEVSLLVGPALRLMCQVPSGDHSEVEHCIAYDASRDKYYSTFLAFSLHQDLSTVELASLPQERFGYEECVAMDGLLMAIPLAGKKLIIPDVVPDLK